MPVISSTRYSTSGSSSSYLPPSIGGATSSSEKSSSGYGSSTEHIQVDYIPAHPQKYRGLNLIEDQSIASQFIMAPLAFPGNSEMGSNRTAMRDGLGRKKKKKNKKIRKSTPKVQEDHRMANVVLNRPLGGKIPDLIRETLANITREKIVQLLFQVKEKADHCYDFDISFWLQKFLDLCDDANLIEAAYLIVNAGYIYERKVDLLYELVRRSAESSRNAAEDGEKKNPAVPKTRRKITRQAVSLHDRLYESEMLVKQFKQMPAERITELISSAAHKVPSHYFKKWAEYKLWRQNHKKKMKNPVPYSSICEDLYLHPAMWGLSCIEDFDYDDDLDTKRNYRMFTHHMEHRFNTIVPDVNFIMHFKVKDFIEAEEDEIEMMKILDLPTPPTREWPPFCRTSYSKEYAKEAFNVDIGESAEDYVKKYVDLEDIVLEKPTYEIDSDLLRSATEARKNYMNVDIASRQSPQELIYEQLKRIMEAKTAVLAQNNSRAIDTNLNKQKFAEIPALQEMSNIVDVQNSEDNEDVEFIDDSHQSVDIMRMCPDTDDVIVPASIILETAEGGENIELHSVSQSAELPESNNTFKSIEKMPCDTAEADIIERIATDLAKALKSNSPVNIVHKSDVDKRPSEAAVKTSAVDLQTNQIALTHTESKNASSIISENIKNNISDQIVIRVSIDEGIAFCDLDDVDKAMLSPVVELVDILNPFKPEMLDFDEINLSTGCGDFRNLFGIDERYLQYQEDFNLPVDILYKQPNIVHNLFKLPESRLRRRTNFALPQEYDIYMVQRLKRKCSDKNDSGPTRMVKVFKLNDQNMKNIHVTPPTTPNREEDFLGFDEVDLSFIGLLSSSFDSTNVSKLLPSTTNRSISRDSGIGLSSISDSQLITSSIAESDENFTVELTTECGEVMTANEIAKEVIDESVPVLRETPTIEETPLVAAGAIVEESEGRMMDDDDFCENDEVPFETCAIESQTASANETVKTSSAVVVQDNTKSTAQSSIQESADFEQNLYEKCTNNDRVEKRASEMNMMTERIQKWHRYLRPILAVSMERHHFDIFGIGTDIMNSFPKEDAIRPQESIISLENVMESRDPTFLSRYFLSMLQLTNAGNVDIKIHQRDPNQPTPISDIRLKLLSRKRHSVAIEDDIGARVLSSRKRNHSIGDDSDSASESEQLAIHATKRNDNRSRQEGIANNLNPKSQTSSNRKHNSYLNENASYIITDDRNIATSKSSTPRETNVVSSISNTRNLNVLKRPLSTYPSTITSPIAGPSTQTLNDDPNYPKAVRASNSSLHLHKKFHSNGKKISSNVSNQAVISIYKNKIDDTPAFTSNNLLKSSKKQEKLSRHERSSKELPPFSSIRRFDVAKQGQESSQTIFQSPRVRGDSTESELAFCTPMPIAPASQNAVYNSSVVYPKLIRSQDAILSLKHSRIGHDDLDSGIFSEFSSNENNPTDRDS